MDGDDAVDYQITFDDVWPILQEEAIDKIIDFLELEEQPHHQLFTSDECMQLYTLVYDLCFSGDPNTETQKLYEKYKRTFEDYISLKVLPSLRGKENENLLRELLRRWKNNKIMTSWLSKFLNYLSRYYIPRWKLPSLVEISHSMFCNLVFKEINGQVGDISVSLIDREREGEQIDQALLKEVLNIYKEIKGDDASKKYRKDIEEEITKATSAFYSKKAFNWIANKSYDDYMLQVKKCLEHEKSSNYLGDDVVYQSAENELLKTHASKIEEKKLRRDGGA